MHNTIAPITQALGQSGMAVYIIPFCTKCLPIIIYNEVVYM